MTVDELVEKTIVAQAIRITQLEVLNEEYRRQVDALASQFESTKKAIEDES